MKTVHEVSEISGVSVRTLHHYDKIGLLKPAKRTESGYRLYSHEDMERLRLILLFRELEFPLSEVKRIIEAPDFDVVSTLSKQEELLILKRDRLNRLIDYTRKLMNGGGRNMEFIPFDKKEQEKLKNEAFSKWGDTAAFKESAEKESKRTETEESLIAAGLMDIFVKFGAEKDKGGLAHAEALVKELRDYITENYYTCTKEILSGLGQMYAFDERFRSNIDRAAGGGTALFVSQAIEKYGSK